MLEKLRSLEQPVANSQPETQALGLIYLPTTIRVSLEAQALDENPGLADTLIAASWRQETEDQRARYEYPESERQTNVY